MFAAMSVTYCICVMSWVGKAAEASECVRERLQLRRVKEADDNGGKVGGEVCVSTGEGRADGSRVGSRKEALTHRSIRSSDFSKQETM